MKIAKLLIITNVALLIFGAIMISDLDNIGKTFTVSYVVVASLNVSNFVLSQTMLTRVLKDDSRATILSF
jgi:hypothetical protein